MVMLGQQRILLILDVDETLVYARSEPFEDRVPDFKSGSYCVYRRPHLEQFLATCSTWYDLAIWSSGGSTYVRTVAANIMPPNGQPVFVWCREHCTLRRNSETGDCFFQKNLRKIKRQGFDLDHVLIVEDTPENVQRHYDNAIFVSSWTGESSDNELVLLEQYLASIHAVANIRKLEKRGWRQAHPLP